MNAPRKPQGGFTMVVALIMLILMMTLAVTAFRLGRASLQVMDNLQQHNTEFAATQQALDKVISSSLFTTNPTGVFAGNGCPSTLPGPYANLICVDVNGDGKSIVVVTLNGTRLTPSGYSNPLCIKALTISNSQLDVTNSADQPCTKQQDVNFTGYTPQTGNTDDSLCSTTTWDINASASAPTVSSALTAVPPAQFAIDEGVGIRDSTDDVANFCP